RHHRCRMACASGSSSSRAPGRTPCRRARRAPPPPRAPPTPRSRCSRFSRSPHPAGASAARSPFPDPAASALPLSRSPPRPLLDAQHGYSTLAQFQSAIAIVDRLVRVHSLPRTAGSRLVESAVAVTFNDDGAYAGGMARWIERSLLPAIGVQVADDVDAQLI